MPELLSWDDVDGNDAFDDKSEYIERADNTIKALAQKLADSPCPGCYATQAFCEPGTRLRSGPPDDDIESCPHCGGFPRDRWGYFAVDAEDAHRRVKEEQDAQSRTDKG